MDKKMDEGVEVLTFPSHLAGLAPGASHSWGYIVCGDTLQLSIISASY